MLPLPSPDQYSYAVLAHFRNRREVGKQKLAEKGKSKTRTIDLPIILTSAVLFPQPRMEWVSCWSKVVLIIFVALR